MRNKNGSFILLCLAMFLMAGGAAMAQSITVTSPAAGNTWYVGTTHNITWSKVGSMDANVKITLYNSTGTTKIADITDSTPNDGSFEGWTVPASGLGDCVVRVKTLDNAVFDDSGVFHIANAPAASIVVTFPASGAELCRGLTYNIVWTKTGTMHASVKITLYDGTGTTKQLDITDTTANDGSYPWAVPDDAPLAGTHVVRVKTLDNAVSDDSAQFTFKDCGDDDDDGIDWDRIRDKIREMLEAEIVPWWRIKGPWPGPGPCLSCGMEFGLDKIRERLDALKLRTQLGVELFNQDGKLADLGKFGKGLSLKGSARLGKINSRQNDLLVSGKGFKLVFRNSLGEIVHTQAINIEEKTQGMMR